jgi:hypothetical protein
VSLAVGAEAEVPQLQNGRYVQSLGQAQDVDRMGGVAMPVTGQQDPPVVRRRQRLLVCDRRQHRVTVALGGPPSADRPEWSQALVIDLQDTASSTLHRVSRTLANLSDGCVQSVAT